MMMMIIIIKQKYRKFHTITGQESLDGITGTTVPFLDFRVRWKWEVNASPQPHYPREMFGMEGAEILAPTGIRSPDRPARRTIMQRLKF